jgi:GNAT superfamily N-acetyltransferase
LATRADLLRTYNDELRARIPAALAPDVEIERDGPVQRVLGLKGHGFVEYHDLEGIAGRDLDELIARQIRVFAARGEAFEWKLHGHDLPEDLPTRLQAAGLVPEDEETVVIAPVSAIAAEPRLPAGVVVREVTERRDLDRIVVMEEAVWDEPHGWLAPRLEEELTLAPESLTVTIAEAGDEVVCAAWIRYEQGTQFATLWGGATLPDWRGRGIYRGTVAYRANLAAQRGFRYLEVDASADSRPILERLGFTAVTTTTPYVWSPRPG